jgi:uncharacterized protein with von Willebrand factor type A (vWA) domain
MSTLVTYSAVYPVSGSLRRMFFEAENEQEARDFAAKCGAGLEGPATHVADWLPAEAPENYDEKTARRLLGGVSRSTLYRELALGKLERVPGLRKVLVTRRSLERWRK